MKYEVVQLEQKTIAGIGGYTGNNDPEMGATIGALWRKLYEPEIQAGIGPRVNAYAVGLYSGYSGDRYHVLAGYEVAGDGIQYAQGIEVRVIPAGKYARFSFQGHMVTGVAAAWEEIWAIGLDRSFTGDFEEYLDSDVENARVNIYIALK